MNGLNMNALGAYRDEEIIRFLDPSNDPIVKELCRRLSEPQAIAEFQEDFHEMEHELEEKNSTLSKVRKDRKLLAGRVVELLAMLKTAGVTVPVELASALERD